MLAATKVKMSGGEKKMNRNTYNIYSIKRVTRKFLEVSRCFMLGKGLKKVFLTSSFPNKNGTQRMPYMLLYDILTEPMSMAP